MPFITLASPTDTVVLMGDDPYATGYTYRNDTLTSWYKFAGADAPKDKRPNAHGSFGYDRLYANEGGITIKGSFFGSSAQEAALARNRLTGLFADGLPVTMTVSDELGVSSRRINVVEADVPWLPYPNFDFELNATVPDPRRYGPSITQTTGAPTPGSGLAWPLGSSTKPFTSNLSDLSQSAANQFDLSSPVETYNGHAFLRGTRNGTASGGLYLLRNARLGVAVGATVTTTVMVRASVALSLTARFAVDGSTSTTFGTTSFSVSANTWTPVTITGTMPSGSSVGVDITQLGTSAAVGQAIDATELFVTYPGSGPYWDWGTVGASGQLTFTNAGNASTSPSFRAYGAAFAAGFRITEVETGRELTYGLPTVATDSVYLNGRYRTVSLNGGGNYTQRLIKRQWFTVPPRTTRTYQFTPLGGYTGTPYLDLIAARADL